MIFGKFATLKENHLLLDNTIPLALFKGDWINVSYPIISKNLLKPQTR